MLDTVDIKERSGFPRFAELPKEIRLAIWEYAAAQPRTVHTWATSLHPEYDQWYGQAMDDRLDQGIVFHHARMMTASSAENQSRLRERDKTGMYWDIRCRTFPVDIACRESRAIALGSTRRKLAFQTRGATSSTRFDFERDTLMILYRSAFWPIIPYHSAGATNLLRIMSSDDLEQVKHLAIEFVKIIEEEPQETEVRYAETIIQCCNRLPHLETLIILDARPNSARPLPDDVLMDPINVEATSTAYKDYIDADHHNSVLPDIVYTKSLWDINSDTMKNVVKEWEIEEEMVFNYPKEVSRQIVVSAMQFKEFTDLQMRAQETARERSKLLQNEGLKEES